MRSSRSLVPFTLLLLLRSPPAGAGPQDDLARLNSDYASQKSEVESLGSKVDGFLAGSRKLREMDRDEITRLIIQICNLDIERNDDEEERIARSQVEKIQSNVRSEYSNVESAGTDLRRRISDVQDKLKTTARYTEPYTKVDEVKSDASRLLDQIKAQQDLAGRLWDKVEDDYKSLTNVKNGVMLGANNPKLRAAMDWGKAKHEYNQRICDEKEISLSSGRPDCVSFRKDACAVWEFKPSTVGESAAKSQAERYVSDVQRYFKDDPRAKENCKKDSSGLPLFEARGVTYEACKPGS